MFFKEYNFLMHASNQIVILSGTNLSIIHNLECLESAFMSPSDSNKCNIALKTDLNYFWLAVVIKNK